jgi:CHAD domain-containing protein
MEITKEKNVSLYKFLHRQIEMFKGYFLVTRASLDKESIHQMRVAVKRINTFYKLKKHINFPIVVQENLFDAIKKIYGSSGNLRDVHIQKSLLKEFRKKLQTPFPELKKHLGTVEKKFQQELFSIAESIDFSGIGNDTQNETVPDNLSSYASLEKESIIYISRKIEKIHRMLLSPNQGDMVHDMRKQVKQLYFVLQFLREYYPESVFSKYRIKPLRNITNRLGRWNDLAMFNSRVKTFMANQHDTVRESDIDYYLLIKTIDTEKQELLQDIDAHIWLELKLLEHIQINNTNLSSGR